MTVETEDNRRVYPADGVKTNFVFDFKVDDPLTLFVKEDGVITGAAVVINLNPDQENNPGGSVDVTPPILAPIIVSVERIVDLTQGAKYPVGGKFPSKIHEKALDKAMIANQQAADTFNRAIKTGPDEPLTGISLLVPSPVNRALLFMAFDSVGNLIMAPGTGDTLGPVTPYMATLLAAPDPEEAKRLLESLAGFKHVPVAGTDTYTSVNVPVHPGYVTGAIYFGDFINLNLTIAPTWDIDGLGPITIVSTNGTAIEVGALNGDHLLRYDGVNFRLLNPAKPSPSFKATLSAQQSNITGSEKLLFDNVVFDTNSDYDNLVNFRYTPSIAGKYLFIVHSVWQGLSIVAADRLLLSLAKNGVIVDTDQNTAAYSNEFTQKVSVLLEFNGTTDYAEVFAENQIRDTSNIQQNASFSAVRVSG